MKELCAFLIMFYTETPFDRTYKFSVTFTSVIDKKRRGHVGYLLIEQKKRAR